MQIVKLLYFDFFDVVICKTPDICFLQFELFLKKGNNDLNIRIDKEMILAKTNINIWFASQF